MLQGESGDLFSIIELCAGGHANSYFLPQLLITQYNSNGAHLVKLSKSKETMG